MLIIIIVEVTSVKFQEPLEAIDMLVTLNESVEAAVVVYLLGDILNDFNSTNMADQEQLLEVLLAVHFFSTFNIPSQGFLHSSNTLLSRLNASTDEVS